MTKYVSPYVTSTLILLNWLVLLEGIVISVVQPSFAQSNIVPDNTLGVENSRVINNLSREEIIGGAQRGINLFHSFQEFNLSEGSSVFFNNPAGIENILGRVTGNNPSNILGTLGVLGEANLFLLNPNGIIFGENASLDINGSFVATSANAIQFGEQGFFSADASESLPLLTINPSAFLFNQMATGAIQNQSTAPAGFDLNGSSLSGLRVGDRSSLLFLGGEIVINGGGLNALDGRVELVGVSKEEVIELNTSGKNLALNFPLLTESADISLGNRASVHTSGEFGGEIRIQGRNVSLANNSSIVSNTQGSQDGQGIFVRANNLTLDSNSFLTTNLLGQGKGGNINIETGQLTIQNGAVISSSVFGQGDAGDINLNVEDTVTITGLGGEDFNHNNPPPSIVTSVTPEAQGNSGKVNINAGSFSLANFTVISAENLSWREGNAGNVSITAQNDILISESGVSVKRLAVDDNGTSIGKIGNAGNIILKADRIDTELASFLDSSTFVNGNSGNISLEANSISLIDPFISNQIRGEGQAGNLNIIAEDSLLLRGERNLQPTVTIETKGSSQGGNINLQGRSVSLEGGIVINAITQGSRNAGNVTINSNQLKLTNVLINVSTFGTGKGGRVSVNADESVEIIGYGLSRFQEIVIEPTRQEPNLLKNVAPNDINTQLFQGILAGTDGSGDAGGIEINTRHLRVLDGSLISASSNLEKGRAGSIILNTDDWLEVSQAVISASTVGSNNAGNIEINTGKLSISGGGQIISTTSGEGQAGDLNINATEFIELKGIFERNMPSSLLVGSLRTEATGNGGGLHIVTPQLTVRDGAVIAATTLGQSNGGNIEIDAKDSIDIINNGTIAVNSQGQGNAGKLNIQTNLLTLANNSQILATTESNDGGNIQLKIANSLLLNNNSNISTRAGRQGAGGNGGNIEIDANLLVAFPQENNDITANAFGGAGGNIEIFTTGIFGLEERNSNPLNKTNDIDASSEFGLDGEVVINLLDVNPVKGLEDLLTETIDVTSLIAQGCLAGHEGTKKGASQFILTGRGGVPPQPEETLRLPAIIIDDDRVAIDKQQVPPQVTDKPIMEANGWIINDRGKVMLIASVSSPKDRIYWLNPAKCHDF